MTELLLDLPDSVLLGTAACVGLALVASTGLMARRRPSESPTSTAALDAYKIIVNFTAILLSFSLVQAVGTFRSTEASVSKEAGAMNQLDRVLLRYQTPATAEIRPLLQHYVQSVIRDDWPAMSKGHIAPESAALLRKLSRAVQTLDGGIAAKPQLYAEMLRHLDALHDARQDRLDAGGMGVPWVLWKAVAALCLVLLGLSTVIQMPGRLVAIGGHAIALGVLIALVFTVDSPFRGETTVDVAPIARVLTSIMTRTE